MQNAKPAAILEGLDTLLGSGPDALTTENFVAKKFIIEGAIFSGARQLGVNVDDIVADYQVELLQSSGGPDHPSDGRLHYIKGHLKKLREMIQEKMTPASAGA